MSSKRLLPAALGKNCPFKVIGYEFNVEEIAAMNDYSLVLESDIRTSYRSTARITHPDKNPDDPNAKSNFDLLQKAYEWIKDKPNREAYLEALVQEYHNRKRAASRDQNKGKLASSLLEREKEAKDARQAVDKRFSEFLTRQEKMREETQNMRDQKSKDDMVYNLINKTRGQSSAPTKTLDPKIIGSDTWGSFGGVTAKSNSQSFIGKWRSTAFMESTAMDFNQFMAFEKNTLDLADNFKNNNSSPAAPEPTPHSPQSVRQGFNYTPPPHFPPPYPGFVMSGGPHSMVYTQPTYSPPPGSFPVPFGHYPCPEPPTPVQAPPKRGKFSNLLPPKKS